MKLKIEISKLTSDLSFGNETPHLSKILFFCFPKLENLTRKSNNFKTLQQIMQIASTYYIKR